MNWQPIETAPKDTPVLVYGKDLYGHFIVTGAELGEYGWRVLGVSGYEWETDVEPTHWAPPEFPES